MPAVPPPVPVPATQPSLLDDVGALLDDSRPRPAVRQIGRVMIAVWVTALVGPFLGLNAWALETLAILITVGFSVYLSNMGRLLRLEAGALDEVESLLALHRTNEAVPILHRLMSRPMRVVENRLRAMMLLGSVFARLSRTDDAIYVFNELINAEGLAGPAGVMVKIARVTEMLRADHLYDADGAINDLRRLLERGGMTAEIKQFDASLPTRHDPAALAGLRLVELYRDVKTGHLDDAVEHFETQLPMLRAGLGHRVAEAHALIALAYHRQNRPELAAARFLDATALAPLSELVRKYAELWPLTQAYPMTLPPR